MRSWKPHNVKAKIQALAFSPDGRTLATTGGMSRFVWLWDVLTGSELAKLDRHTGPVLAVEFSPDGRHLASLEREAVLIWDVDALAAPVARLQPKGAETQLTLLTFAPDGTRLVAAGEREVVWWDRPCSAKSLTPRKPSGSEGRVRGRPYSLRYTPDGSRFLIGATELEIWLPDLGTPFAFIEPTRRAGVRSVAVSPDGTRVAFALKNAVPVYRLADRTREATLNPSRDPVSDVAFARDGNSLLTAGTDGTVRAWAVGSWTETRRFDWGIGTLTAFALSTDGLTGAAGSANGQVVVWDVDM